MLEEEKDTALEEGKTEVEENQGEPSSLEDTVESDQAAMEANANVAEDQELKVLPESEEEKGKEIIVAADAAKKSLPRATTTIGKRKKQQQRKQQQQRQQQEQRQKETAITNVSKQLEQQTTETRKIKSILQSQLELIKKLQSQLKQVQKQISQIQKAVAKKKKK